MVSNLQIIVPDCNRISITVNYFRKTDIHNISYVRKFHRQVTAELLIHVGWKLSF
ncbi:hypothetical protein D3C86_2261510 [compost metagenome]